MMRAIRSGWGVGGACGYVGGEGGKGEGAKGMWRRGCSIYNHSMDFFTCEPSKHDDFYNQIFRKYTARYMRKICPVVRYLYSRLDGKIYAKPSHPPMANGRIGHLTSLRQ